MEQKQPVAYSYARFSSLGQVGNDSLRRQLELSKNYALKHGLTIVDDLRDLGMSAYKGKNAKDGAFSKFIENVNLGKIQEGSYLLVESLDRLSRQEPMAAFNIFGNLLTKGIVIVTLQDEQKFTRDSLNQNPGQLFMSIGGMVRSHEESEVKSKRLKGSWENRRRTNLAKKSKLCPAWLTLDQEANNYVLNEQMANNIKKIFDMSINGSGASTIEKFLNKNKDQYPPLNVKRGWYAGYIKKILYNRSVFGEYTPCKMDDGKRVKTDIIIKDYFPAIISEETFNLNLAKMKQRSFGGQVNQGETLKNLFAHLILCGHCGGKVIFRDKTKTVGGARKLRCNNAERSNDCTALSWDYDEFEQTVFKYIVELDLKAVFTDDTTISKKEEITNRIISNQHQLDLNKNKQNQIIDELLDCTPELKNALRKKAEDITANITNIENEIVNLNHEISLLANEVPKHDIQDSIANYKQLIADKNSDEIRSIRLKIQGELRQLIKYIKFDNSHRFHIGDEIDEWLCKDLKRKRYCKEDAQIKYLLSKASLNYYDSYTRQFIVAFSNGATRLIRPAKHWNMKFQQPFHKNIDLYN